MKKVFLKVFAVVVLGCSIASMCIGAAAENSIKRNADVIETNVANTFDVALIDKRAVGR